MIDLHNHSNYSDGVYEPAQVVENAARDGLKAVALCDNDCLWGVAEAKRKAKEVGIDFISGVELTIKADDDKNRATKTHMLGLFVEPSAHLEDIHVRIKEAKNAFTAKLATAFRDNYAIPVYFEDIRKDFRGAISVGAFTQYMLQHGMIQKTRDCKLMMRKLLVSGKIEQPPEFGISAQEAIDAIHEVGGFAILAHPYRMGLRDNDLFSRIKEYKKMGMDGLECYYKNYKKDEEKRIHKSLEMACALSLLVSGGSDYREDKIQGRFSNGGEVPDEVLVDLKEARGMRSAIFQKSLIAKRAHVYE